MPLACLIHARLTASVAKGREDTDWAGFAREVSASAGLSRAEVSNPAERISPADSGWSVSALPGPGMQPTIIAAIVVYLISMM